MSTRLVIDSTNQLQELKEPGASENRALKWLAKAVSYIFHPVFIPVYIVFFLLYVHPGVFAGFSSWKKTIVLFQALVPYILFPVVTVLLLKALNFIDSIFLITRKDRIIPYIACNLWYFWIWYVWHNQPEYPSEVVILAMSIFLASVFGMLANIYMKVSMHGIAMGVMICYMVLLSVLQPASFGMYISAAFFVGGIVCTARLIISNHTQKEIYAGLLCGFLAVMLAIWFN